LFFEPSSLLCLCCNTCLSIIFVTPI
jgi:hypothetical protein